MAQESGNKNVECWIVGNSKQQQWHHSILGSTNVFRNEVAFDVFNGIHPTKSFSELTLEEKEMVFKELKKLQ